MPQANPQIPQLILVGSPYSGAGQTNTGQVLSTTGGTKEYCSYSGAGAVQIHLGAGRLESVNLLTTAVAGTDIIAASGLPVVLYDAHTPGTGPVVLSGHKLLAGAVVKAAGPLLLGYNSGETIGLQGDQFRKVGITYTSGLCLSQVSGCPGVVVNYTPVISG